MSEDRRKILGLLAEGKITADEAERLIGALGRDTPTEAAGPPPSGPKNLRIRVEKERGGRDPHLVDVRVPLGILRAGVKLQGLLPAKARASMRDALADKGVDFDVDRFKVDNLDAFIAALGQSAIDIDADDGKSRVRISCE